MLLHKDPLFTNEIIIITSQSYAAENDPERLAEFVVLLKALTPLKTRVMASYPGIGALHLSIGTPQKLTFLDSLNEDELEASGQVSVDFRVPDTFKRLEVMLTPFSSSWCVQFDPPTFEHDSDFQAFGMIGIDASPSNRGAVLSLLLTRTNNNSSNPHNNDGMHPSPTTVSPICVFTILVREANVTSTSNVVIGGPATPTLLSGIPQYDLVEKTGGERYYLFYMPQTTNTLYQSRTVEFTLDPQMVRVCTTVELMCV